MEKENSNIMRRHIKGQKDFDCSLGITMTVIGSKWRAIILWHVLKAEPIRYGELKKCIPKISHKVFSQALKSLEMDGLIIRVVYDSNPPKVEYTSTPLGNSLKSILSELCEWGRGFRNSSILEEEL